MTKRYYYTDPLKAAIAARDFGVELIYSGGNKVDDFRELLQFECTYLVDYEPPYYTHPNSLHLFEPQEGDLCFVLASEHNGEVLHSKDWHHWKKEWSYPAYKCVKIYERNGQYFPWYDGVDCIIEYLLEKEKVEEVEDE